jgi:hypothetical protein
MARPAFLRLLAVLVSPVLPCSAALAQTWTGTTHDYVRDEVQQVLQSRDGRVLAIADTGRALALVKRNADGSLLWQRLLMGVPNGEAGSGLVELPDGRIAVAGDAHVDAHGNDDVLLAVVTADGARTVWQRAYGGSAGADRALALLALRDGGYLLVGETLSWGGPGFHMLALRVDGAGAPAWARAWGEGSLVSAVELPDGGFLAASRAGTVLRLDASGELLWARGYGFAGIGGMASRPDGTVAIAGHRTVADADVAELVVLDPAGEIVRRASYGQPGVTFRFFALAPLADGGLLAAGEVNGPGFTDLYGWIVRLDPGGEVAWQRHLNDGGGEVHAIAPTRDGGVVLGGHRNAFPKMMTGRFTGSGLGPACAGPATQAARLASSLPWTPASVATIPVTDLAVTDPAKPVSDAPTPQDEVVCTGGPTFPPSEVSPPAASSAPLRFDAPTLLVWEPAAPSGSASFDLFRTDLAAVRAGSDASCLQGGLAASQALDPDVPVDGAGFVYLVRGRNASGPGTLGHRSDGSERVAAATCP